MSMVSSLVRIERRLAIARSDDEHRGTQTEMEAMSSSFEWKRERVDEEMR